VKLCYVFIESSVNCNAVDTIVFVMSVGARSAVPVCGNFLWTYLVHGIVCLWLL